MWALTALHVGLLALYTVLVPTFRAPDEYVHVDMARRVAQERSYPAPDDLLYVAAPIIAARDISRAYDSFAPPAAEDQVQPRGTRPAFDDLGDWDDDSPAVNQLVQHPPLYYGVAAAAYAAFDVLPFDQHVAVLRLLSVLLVAPLPLLAWATARRLGASTAASLAAAAALVVVPGLTHMGSVVNNDGALMLGGGVLAYVAARVATGDLGHRTALLGGLAGGLTLLVKGFALFVVPWVVAAYAIPAARGRVRPAAVRAAEMGAVAMAIGGWWWVRNLVVYGGVQPGLTVLPQERTVEPDLWDYATRFVGRFLGGFWGSFGWRETNVPWVVATLAVLAGVAALVAALSLRGRVGRGKLAYMLAPAAVLFGGVAVHAWKAYLKRGEPAATQGRYLYVAVVGLAVVAAVGLARLAGRRRDRLPLAVLAAGVPLHAAAVWVIVTRYWAGDGAGERIQTLLAFSPWPPAAVGALAGALVAVAVWTFAELADPRLRRLIRREPAAA